MEPALLIRRLVDRAAQCYRRAGRFAWHFARGKLGGDPVFAALLARGLIPDQARILDLGCGQGLLAAWLEASAACHRAGEWCTEWPPPPQRWRYRGIDRMPPDVARARAALGERAQFHVGDFRAVEFGMEDTVVLLDVLHYLDIADQEAVLRRVRSALSQGGVLLLRISHADGGLPFRFSNWVDQVVLLCRGRGWVRLHCRPVQAWISLLAGIGFQTERIPMSAHTPFANVLLVARPG